MCIISNTVNVTCKIRAIQLFQLSMFERIQVSMLSGPGAFDQFLEKLLNPINTESEIISILVSYTIIAGKYIAIRDIQYHLI